MRMYLFTYYAYRYFCNYDEGVESTINFFTNEVSEILVMMQFICYSKYKYIVNYSLFLIHNKPLLK